MLRSANQPLRENSVDFQWYHPSLLAAVTCLPVIPVATLYFSEPASSAPTSASSFRTYRSSCSTYHPFLPATSCHHPSSFPCFSYLHFSSFPDASSFRSFPF